MMDYTLTRNNLHLCDSYKVRRWRMRRELKAIKAAAIPGQTIVFRRSLFSLQMEWLCHNTLYWLGIQRDRTKDADLDNPCDHPEALYIAAGLAVTIAELAVVFATVYGLLCLIF